MIDAEARMDVNAAAAVPVRSIAFTAGLFLCPVKSSQLFM
jgi:hypothetical protein